VIAPVWSVEDGAAKKVAHDVYEAVLADPRKPFAAIMSEIRARSYEGTNPPDSYAAYCFLSVEGPHVNSGISAVAGRLHTCSAGRRVISWWGFGLLCARAPSLI
jgi:hypothetical protein